MKYLIDTHTFIWYATGDKRLSNRAIEIMDSDKDKYVSIASLWEMSIKINIGKLSFIKSFEEVVQEQIRINDYKILSINKSHLFKLSSLTLHHRDPFDRIIICQSIIEKVPVISADNNFKHYEKLEVIW